MTNLYSNRRWTFRRWTLKEEESFKKLYPTEDYKELGKIFERNRHGITRKAMQLGLHKSRAVKNYHISQSLIGKFDHKGSKNPAWKGGKNLRWWANSVKTRDKYTCRKCGLKDPEIVQAHHIKPKSLFPELKFRVSNGITLCPNCDQKSNKQIHYEGNRLPKNRKIKR